MLAIKSLYFVAGIIMHTGNLQPCTQCSSVRKCTLEAFVLQQLEQKHEYGNM